MVVLSRKVSLETKKYRPVRTKNSQAHLYSLISPMLPYLVAEINNNKATQSKNHYKKTFVRIIFTDTEAYWIADNQLYVAKTNDGVVDEDSVKVVDTMTMDKVQLEKLAFIVEQLTEGL